MTNYDDIYEEAADNYGLITRARANKLGISDKELSRLTSNGRLTRLGHGVYRVKHHAIGELDPYAEAVALAGENAFLYGESVLAMFSLCPTNPAKMLVASPRRVRRNLPEGTKVISGSDEADITAYEGIPSQKVSAAIRACMSTIMPERLIEAAHEARRLGLITEEEEGSLMMELNAS